MNLGAPIGQRNTVPSDGFDQGEHGAGIGLSGGSSAPNVHNSQAARLAAENETSGQSQSGFNSGIGAEHASGGISRSGGHSGQDKFDNSLDRYDGQQSTTGATYGGDSAVSGAYESGAMGGDALTGESHAQRTGAGVGPLGENLGRGTGEEHHHHHHHHHQHATDEALESTSGGTAGVVGEAADTDNITRGPGAHRTVAGEGAVAGQQGEALGGVAVGGTTGGGLPSTGGQYQTGGQYSSSEYTTKDQYSSSGMGAGGVGAGAAAGVGAGAGFESGKSTVQDGANSGSGGGGRQGHFGAAEDDSNRGEPLSDPKDLDSGGPHSLVWHDGHYVHRRDLE